MAAFAPQGEREGTSRVPRASSSSFQLLVGLQRVDLAGERLEITPAVDDRVAAVDRVRVRVEHVIGPAVRVAARLAEALVRLCELAVDALHDSALAHSDLSRSFRVHIYLYAHALVYCKILAHNNIRDNWRMFPSAQLRARKQALPQILRPSTAPPLASASLRPTIETKSDATRKSFASKDLEPRGFEPLTSSMPLRRSTD